MLKLLILLSNDTLLYCDIFGHDALTLLEPVLSHLYYVCIIVHNMLAVAVCGYG